MIYKKLALTVFLMPFTLFGNKTETQLKELKLNKEMELSKLGQAISEKYEYIQSIRGKAVLILLDDIDKKNLKEQEAKEFGKAIDADLVIFVKSLNDTSSINGFFTKELFKKSEDGQIEENFEAIKFYLIRMINEYRILKAFVERYEVLEQEHREISQKLNSL